MATSEAPATTPEPGQAGRSCRTGGVRVAPPPVPAPGPRWFWPSFAVPGMVWLVVLFLLPFYVVLSIAFGAVDPLFDPGAGLEPGAVEPVPVRAAVRPHLRPRRVPRPGVPAHLRVRGRGQRLCLLVAYPVAYYVTRYAGRRKGLLLVALLAPFWISYMMRMLAWVNLLESRRHGQQPAGLGRLLAEPFPWLAGQPVTVTLGLVYGYIPYMVLALFAGLNGIDQRLLEAARDLGRAGGGPSCWSPCPCPARPSWPAWS